MILKEDYENKERIEQDKKDFIDFALKKGYPMDFILDCMEYYQNLISFNDNLTNMIIENKKL